VRLDPGYWLLALGSNIERRGLFNLRNFLSEDITMLQTYQGVVENGVVVLPKQAKLNDGTSVLVVPQIERENEWVTVKQAAKQFETPATLIKQWIKSAKVRVHPENPDFVNADDLEDAIEQNELFNLTMQVAEREENE
jgi:hypothetical protein